jgi:hypothetical protein
MAGRTDRGIVEEIRRAQARKFPQATLGVPDPPAETVIYAYAYLEKTLPFREAFDRLEKPLQFKSGDTETPVAAFGIEEFGGGSERSDVLGDQVTILDYRSDDDFVVRLNTKSKKDVLILAKLEPKATLSDTIRAAQERIRTSSLREYDRMLLSMESVIVPIIEINVERVYDELAGKNVLNPGWTGLYVADARQGVRFRLNERGARLASTAVVPVASALPPEPRRFIFDKPFLVCLNEREAEAPYFALWVETAEVLEPYAPGERDDETETGH